MSKTQPDKARGAIQSSDSSFDRAKWSAHGSGPSLLSICLLPAFLLALAPNTRAAVKTWSGAGTDYTWTNTANWGGTIPVNGDDLVFTGTTRLNNSNNITGLLLNSITYTSSGFTNNGLAMTITNGIVDASGNNTNIIGMTLGASQSFSNQAPGTTLVLNGAINTSSGFGLLAGGDGDLFLSGVISGSGFVTMSGSSLLRLAGANTWSNANGLTINLGTVRLANAAAIPSGPGRGNVTVGTGANLDLGGNSQTINGLDGNGIVGELATNAATYTLTLGTANSNGVFSGNIINNFGIVALTKAGTGTQTLSGASSYVGQTIINQGTLALAAGGSLISTNFTLASGAIFDFAGAGGFNLSGNLTGGRISGFANDIIGNFTLSAGQMTMVPGAAGTLTINGNLNLNGGILNFDLNNTTTVGSGVNDLIALNGGNLDLSGGLTTIRINPIAGTLAAGTYTLINGSVAPIVGSPANLVAVAPRGISASFDTTTTPGSVLMVGSGTAAPASVVWAGNGAGGAWDVSTSQNWLNNNVPDVFYNLDTVTFTDAAGVANATVNIPGAVSPTTVTINNNTVNYVLGVGNADGGLISGTGSLTKNGTGQLTLNTPNNYTGNTTVNGGGLLLGNYLTGGFLNNIVVYNGVPAAGLILNGGGVFFVDQPNTFMSAVFTNLAVNAGSATLAMRNRQANSTTYFYGINTVSRTVGGSLDIANLQTRAGSAVGVYLTNAPPVNGILGGWATVNLSDWVLPSNTGLGSLPYAGYQTNNASPAAWGAISNIAVTATPGASLTTATINSLKLIGAPIVTIGAGQILTLASGGLLVPSTGGGASSITGGTLQGAASADLVVLQNSGANSLTIASVIADNGGATALTKSGPGTLVLSGNNTYAGTTYINGTTLSGGAGATPGTVAAGTLQIGSGGTTGGISNSPTVINNGILTFNRSDTAGYAGLISGSGGVRQLGAGTTILPLDNTYAGVTTISAGTLQVGGGGATGSISNSASVANSGTLAFNRTGPYGYAGVISGSGGLTVQGNGTLRLSANNTYLGNTTINGATLALAASGSISNSAVISVNSTLDVSAIAVFGLSSASAQQLVGSGVVTGSLGTALSTKIIPAGAGIIGSLSFSNNLTLNGGTCTMDVSRSPNDQIIVAGNLTLTAGTIQINVVGAPLTNGTYKLIRYAGALTGSAANLTVAGFSQPGQIATLNSATTGEVNLVVAAGSGGNLVWDGSGSTWDLITADWTNVLGVQVAFQQGDNVRFDDVGVANPTVNITASVAPGSVVVDSATDYAFTGAGKVTGGATLRKNNANTLTVQTLNDYSGPTTIAGGTVQVGAGGVGGALGAGNITNLATLNYNEPADTTVPSDISGTGALHQQGSGVVTLTGNNSLSGLTTVDGGTVLKVGAGGSGGTLGSGNVQVDGGLVFDRAGSLGYAGTVAGAGGITSIGGGIVTLSGSNAYNGNTVIANGTLKVGGSQVIPNGSGFGNVVLDGGTTTAGALDLNGRNETINGLAGTNNTVLGQVLNSVSGTNNLIVGDGDTTAAFSGTIRDNGGSGGKVSVVKIGTGTQTLDVPTPLGNLYTGGTVLSNGIVTITSPGGNNPINPGANAVALGSGPITFYGGTLSIGGSIPQSTTPTWFPPLANTVIVPSNQVGYVNGCQRGGFNPTLLGSGTFNYITAYVRGTIGGDWTAFTGQIVFSGNSNGGNLGVDNASGFPNARVLMITNVAMYGRVAGNPIIPIGELSGGDDSVWFDSTTSTGGGGVATIWSIGGLNSSSSFGGRFIDNVSLQKTGTGTLALTNANLTFTGTTTVSNGTLALIVPSAISNSATITLAASSAILDARSMGYISNEYDENLIITNSFLVTNSTFYLNSPQTLRGIGKLDGSLVAISGSTIAPGLSTGNLTVTTNVVLGGTTVMEINRASTPTSDKLTSPSITAIPGSILTVTNIGTPFLSPGDTFQLFSGAVGGAFDLVTLPELPCVNLTWVNNLAVNGSISVVGTSCVNTTPTNITAVATGNSLDLSWPADHVGWTLLTNAVSIVDTNAWFGYPGSASTNRVILTIEPTRKNVFYRLVYP